MKIFETNQRTFALIGISPPESDQKHSFNVKNSSMFSLLVLGTISSTLYLFCVADTFLDFVNCVNIILGYGVAALVFLIVIFKMKQWFDVIKNLQEIFDKRE